MLNGMTDERVPLHSIVTERGSAAVTIMRCSSHRAGPSSRGSSVGLVDAWSVVPVGAVGKDATVPAYASGEVPRRCRSCCSPVRHVGQAGRGGLRDRRAMPTWLARPRRRGARNRPGATKAGNEEPKKALSSPGFYGGSFIWLWWSRVKWSGFASWAFTLFVIVVDSWCCCQ